MDRLSFERVAGPARGGARRGRLQTAHGPLETPAFLPVGTFGAVRGVAPAELLQVGVRGVLANTYHLWLRPGEQLIRDLGGLHRFMGFSGPILTDSGGYQIHSLGHLARRSEAGVRFRSPRDGSERELTPEGCIAIQEALGADLIVTLDEFEAIDPALGDAQRERAAELLARTLRWAERGRAVQRRADQWLFGIVQGGGFADLRRESAERTRDLGFSAFAIGGLGLGESREGRAALLESALEPLPVAAPRYLMGLGTPPDLVDAIARGVDLFDCVVPTRNGRHGLVYTAGGKRNLLNARFRDAAGPLEPGCECPACSGFSSAYLHHLLRGGEALGARLATLHNLAHYSRLVREAREAITDGRFGPWSSSRLRSYAAGESGSSSARAATDSAA